ncbi:WAT1-related protein At3g28050-like isoform X3 [Hibiscus syriacus]|uniref:WAT1-related protein At3g28050-like isoform X3 n=1 Tax=Hibiscus syriacus TaxID=106335 RepID=UPI001923187B|nr:WAT1-related protein At3g28050-like isoform X3 [Hibiscus syriacus]
MVWRNYYKDVVPFIALVAMEFVIAGLHKLFKAATLTGMSYHVFMVYDYAFAALLLLLLAPFFSYRSRVFPPLRFPILLKIGLLAVIGFVKLDSGSHVSYSSTLPSAMANLMPAITFILAIHFQNGEAGLEQQQQQQ